MHHRTPLLAAAALVTVASLAGAQEPPPDLLKHVKVGQRWTFATTAGEFRTEEVWHVAEVNGDERWVAYLLTTRTSSNGKLVAEAVSQELQRWSGGSSSIVDAATLALSKSTQTRKSLKVPGASLEALVLTTSGVETWTAARGDFDTFPGLIKAVTPEGTVRALEKVEEGSAPVVPAAPPEEVLEGDSNLPKGALDHVKVGQRWIFEGKSGDLGMQLVWKVKAVDAARGLVRYDLTTTARTDEGQTISAETAPDQEWSAGASPLLERGVTVVGVSGERRPLEVPGAKLECYVVKTDLSDVHMAVWTAVKGTREVFPGAVKQIIDGGGFELVRVEGP
jgi:hypothetical protein